MNQDELVSQITEKVLRRLGTQAVTKKIPLKACEKDILVLADPDCSYAREYLKSIDANRAVFYGHHSCPENIEQMKEIVIPYLSGESIVRISQGAGHSDLEKSIIRLIIRNIPMKLINCELHAIRHTCNENFFNMLNKHLQNLLSYGIEMPAGEAIDDKNPPPGNGPLGCRRLTELSLITEADLSGAETGDSVAISGNKRIVITPSALDLIHYKKLKLIKILS